MGFEPAGPFPRRNHRFPGRSLLFSLDDWNTKSFRVRPILIGDGVALKGSLNLSLAAAPIMATNAAVDELLRIVAFVSRDDSWLLRELIRLDTHAKQLVKDDLCGWVKSRPGIVGIVQIGRVESKQEMAGVLRRLIERAYTLLDELPSDKLSIQDIWNVTLLISVPINESERDRHAESASFLDQIARDVTGSRKIVLWSDRRVADYFGPLGQGQNVWRPSSDDPLRETVRRIAANSNERNALEIIFKRRLSQDDIDELLKALIHSHD